jgi:hypothetical protein
MAYIRAMSKDREITINLDKWTSQAQYAKERQTSIQYINKLIRQGKLESWEIKELRVVLVKRP